MLIVEFYGGPLGGHVMRTTPEPWTGGWVPVGDNRWARYHCFHHDPATGIVHAEFEKEGLQNRR
ncbi:hypothetical protein [Streptomyces sp. NBC_01207]|uniref:hypothetical protein n=1 Tax=Streptomyces sp. NBC_01207 TaxID=2903772 RepID=UPI002E1035B4|nr:hypothetical protein OG457_48745 [Streptomyces sp. NBC_01207]